MTEVRLNNQTLVRLEAPTPSWKWIKLSRTLKLKMLNLPGVKIFRGAPENEDQDRDNLM
ncbi:U-exon [Snake adenovirus 1]|uniref:Probable U-exon protein n=1 Tax=Snake adenovirus serotype 1 TaxID=189830 RepID=UXP_ADES1|nr:U-exon [Snake adenovirus 1]A9CB95.1 RecName: Full=Probable U-exon protein [Snake adenovirus 1]ABA47245.1 U-exon [Snake adenovirus 1]